PLAPNPPRGSPVPSPPKGGGANPPAAGAPPATAAGVMQLKKQITGDFSYRFVSASDKAATVTTPPVPLPTPPGGDNIVAIPVPSTVNAKDGMLEVLDNGRGNVARLPISTSGVANLSENSFTMAQRVNIPV